MKTTVALFALAALAGCTDSSSDVMTGTPTLPGGGTPTSGGTQPDMISGSLCAVSDPRAFAGCTVGSTGGTTGGTAATNLGGMAVDMGGHVTLTDESGNFSLPAPSADVTNPVFTVSGAGIISGAAAFTAGTRGTVPVLTAQLYDEMLADEGIESSAGQGALLIGLTDTNGAPVTGATASLSPTPASGPYYDGTAATSFGGTATGAYGVVWAPGATVGPVDVSIQNPQSGNETTVGGVQVIDGGITLIDEQIK